MKELDHPGAAGQRRPCKVWRHLRGPQLTRPLLPEPQDDALHQASSTIMLGLSDQTSMLRLASPIGCGVDAAGNQSVLMPIYFQTFELNLKHDCTARSSFWGGAICAGTLSGSTALPDPGKNSVGAAAESYPLYLYVSVQAIMSEAASW